MISDGYHGRSEIALPNLSERESKKKQFSEYGLRAYLGGFYVNIAKTSFSFLTDKLGVKLVEYFKIFFVSLNFIVPSWPIVKPISHTSASKSNLGMLKSDLEWLASCASNFT